MSSLQGRCPKQKKDGGTKMFQNENKYIPSGYTTATDKELTDNQKQNQKKLNIKLAIPQKVLAHQAMFITKSEKSTC